jgi:hypothetical protein
MKMMTTESVGVGNPSAPQILPEFGRWQDVQRLFGIKRGTLYNLLSEGKVKSVSMRRKGNKQGCRLFYLPGISEYLRSLLQAQHILEDRSDLEPGLCGSGTSSPSNTEPSAKLQ